MENNIPILSPSPPPRRNKAIERHNMHLDSATTSSSANMVSRTHSSLDLTGGGDGGDGVVSGCDLTHMDRLSKTTTSTPSFSFTKLTFEFVQRCLRMPFIVGQLPDIVVPYIWPSSPSSFISGVITGLFIAFLRPTIEFYLDFGAKYLATVFKFIFVWGSVAVITWGVIRLIQKTSMATMTLSPQSPGENVEDFDINSTSIYKSMPEYEDCSHFSYKKIKIK